MLKDIVTLQIEQLNPIVRRYHGRIPLSMWMLHQLKCVFDKEPKQPLSYAAFLQRSIKIDKDTTITGKFLSKRIQFDTKTNTYIEVVKNGSSNHLIEFLISYEKGIPSPPIDYYDKIISDLYLKMKEKANDVQQQMEHEEKKEKEEQKQMQEEQKGQKGKKRQKGQKEKEHKINQLNETIQDYLIKRQNFELAVEKLFISLLTSRTELTTTQLKIVEILYSKGLNQSTKRVIAADLNY